ncbi:class I SAM-dependent methyltransferase [Natronobacterium gregoryi]|uniref:Class I SAM-dependent methyltransferase n=2 Tax=Natronobacterium gregoryi TaxID=44930 RepID=L0AKU6_NATGS|nr:class I SAM-dependent methyltransferase [Natronobacterium gregoryi]AFZ74069.1 methyltransferase family protein [Natronobacterium gregoryi SP2]ELY70370.1 Methyltransferase type 11 [Natronobacterium gregoryi SP2]PLK20810.1 class I SAM-dependent methyltransferase [Natronobacterium gregoryi SP2]SFJ06337.1 Methyltransferase domain-containing protein [Natronobacterium gregoryi]
MDSTDTRHEWAKRSGEYSPEYYAYYGPDETSETVRRLLERFVGRDAAVLELGCSSGRHLAHLCDHGFDELAGIEINDDAFDVMERTYPDLAAEGTFYARAIEDVVTEFDEDRFDAIYSVETLQHLHPEVEWLFDELSRVTADLLVTVENEGDEKQTDETYVDDGLPLYYRDWGRVFTETGFDQVTVESGKRDTVRAFRL